MGPILQHINSQQVSRQKKVVDIEMEKTRAWPPQLLCNILQCPEAKEFFSKNQSWITLKI